MHMSFWWDYNLGNLYIDNISIHSVIGMVLTCLFMIILTIIFEGFKTVEMKILHDIGTETLQDTRRNSEERNNLLSTGDMQISLPGCSSQTQQTTPLEASTNKKFLRRVFKVFLFSTNNMINYMLMLAFMLYNGYLAVSIIFGAFLGHLLFGHIMFRYHFERLLRRKKVLCSRDMDDNENGTTPPLTRVEGSLENNCQPICEIEVHSHNRNDIHEDINISMMENVHDDTQNVTTNENVDVEESKSQTSREEIC